MRASCLLQSSMRPKWNLPLMIWLLMSYLLGIVSAMGKAQLDTLRTENDQLFYHGFDSYLKYAFPEDELRPLNCSPLTRDRDNPNRLELNDPLGNYSLTLVDTLSTLAVLASSGAEHERSKALSYFQNGVKSLVELYGDGSNGVSGNGSRARGFDLDSKVSVFETVIRGVGGLLSAHLFAMGELPITGYNVTEHLVITESGEQGIRWSSHFVYDGQLLRLANDLASRLLPAFATSTGIPYPRVNLRHGISFYTNSCGQDGELCHWDDGGQCPVHSAGTADTTKTCTAGAGTLMLEFIVLSRLTGDYVFENVAKRAFWSIWERRTKLDLVGSDIDAETGEWLGSYTGLGAGVDSFYEYALKAYIILSGAEEPSVGHESKDPTLAAFYPPPLRKKHHQPESFFRVWQKSHKAINKHLRRDKSYGYPHFVQGDAYSGAAKALWMDALSAFYPGLLTLAGHVEEAIENHVLFTALWSRYSAMPERWSVASGDIEHGLGWWLGRPEFIESNLYLYRATRDPWYLHVGEMTLKDIKTLCWVPCGLSGIQDVRTMERNNRMESFFLGETAKYLHLLFNPEHPLNHLDAPYVFSTEGHPLIIPSSYRKVDGLGRAKQRRVENERCEIPKPARELSVSNIAGRSDLFHAASLVRLQLEPKLHIGPILEKSPITYPQGESPTNYTFFPWTLPKQLIPHNSTSSLQSMRPTFDVTFPKTTNVVFPTQMLSRLSHGILVGSLSALRIGMIQDIPVVDTTGNNHELFRIHSINHMPLGRDEKVLINRDSIAAVVKATDPLFARVEDSVVFNLVVDVAAESQKVSEHPESTKVKGSQLARMDLAGILSPVDKETKDFLSAFEVEVKQVLKQAAVDDPDNQSLQSLLRLASRTNPAGANKLNNMITSEATTPYQQPPPARLSTPGITSQGAGAAPLPISGEFKGQGISGKIPPLPWTSIYIGDEGCSPLESSIPRNHQVIILKRGGCSFAEKITNIPLYPPSSSALQLVIVVSFSDLDSKEHAELVELDGRNLIRPLISEVQTSRSGIVRRKPIPLVMIGGGERVWNEIILGRWKGIGVRKRISIETNGIRIGNLVVL